MSSGVDHAAEPLVAPESVGRWIARLPQPVAVTGGTGFVGSHLVDTLCAAGVRPRVLVRRPEAARWIGARPVQWVPGSLEDPGSLRRLVEGARAVIHLAGIVRATRAVEFDRANREGTARLVAALAELAPAARMLQVSSLTAVGPSPDPAGVGPETVPHPVSAYGRSKLAAEAEARRAPEWVILRPPAIYGPRDTDVLQFFRMARSGLALLPAGERWVTVAHVADVVRGILAGAVAAPGRVFHLGEPEPHRMREMLLALAAAGGVRVRVLRVPAAAVTAAGLIGGSLSRLGMHRVALTPDKARELLARHWTSRTAGSLAEMGIEECLSFAEGATRTWAWYRGQGWLS